MTGRRSITEEARKRQQGAGDQSDVDADESEDESPDRRKFTQRMPEPLVEQIDQFADKHGMSRNAAINLLARSGLNEF